MFDHQRMAAGGPLGGLSAGPPEGPSGAPGGPGGSGEAGQALPERQQAVLDRMRRDLVARSQQPLPEPALVWPKTWTCP